MGLASGSRLGTYEILSSLGAGGMGEVYRARDTKLGREVAIKVIRPELAADPDRIARLHREAKVLASINHHHIAALYGLEQSAAQHFLVMELVEGETLADRLQHAALSIEDALRIGIQVCEALEAAHEKGIVHRDLKPANIKITPDERVKVLDFGLAKAAETEPASAANLANSPTLSMMATSAGVILGTAAYMSPEQAKGLPADHRSDVFSFGVVLFEMLTGRQPFHGETPPDVLASVLVREPELGRLPRDINPRLSDLLRRCLEKSQKRRWQAIGDVRAELESIAASPRLAPETPGRLARAPLWRRVVSIAAAAVLGAAAGASAVRVLAPPPSTYIARFSILLAPGEQFSGVGRHSLAISPDGLQLVYNVSPGGLFVRPLDSLEARNIKMVAATIDRVTEPVFSPDGTSIAFWSAQDQTLKRVSVAGGAADTICPSRNPLGLSWQGPFLLYGQDDGRIMRVSASGGTPETLVQLTGDVAHGPHLLPDGDHLLFTKSGAGVGTDRWDSASIVVQSLKTGERKTIIEHGTDGAYVPTGHVTYVVRGTLFAVKFDASTATVSGGPVAVVQGVRRVVGSGSGAAQYSFSDNGTLVYVSGPASGRLAETQLAVAALEGTVELLKLPAGTYQFPRVSPDGTRVAYDAEFGNQDHIWIYPLSGGSSPRRLTVNGNNRAPIWSPDNTRVVYQSDRDGSSSLYVQPADGSAAAERLTTADPSSAHWPESWSPDGSTILFRIDRAGVAVLSTLALRDRAVAPFGAVQSEVPTDAVFSPNGRWVCYTKGSGGRPTIYVQPYPTTGAEYEFSPDRGMTPHHPVWSHDGRRIFFNQTPTSIASVTVTTEPAFAFGNAVTLKKPVQMEGAAVRRQHDILPDGRLLGLVEPGLASAGTIIAPPMHIVLNWFDDLRARVAVR
jgi:serine/threonine-protein kinase